MILDEDDVPMDIYEMAVSTVMERDFNVNSTENLEEHFLTASHAIMQDRKRYQWQPIDTAPVGEVVLVVCWDRRYLAQRFEDGDWLMMESESALALTVDEGRSHLLNPTKWMHLPPIPDEGEAA